MASPTNLAALPPEIFEDIAERVSATDLKSLRLACRSANDKTLRTYTQVYFTEREIWLGSESSLRDSLAVADHAVFGPSLRNIIICPHEHDTLCPKEALQMIKDTRLDLHLLTTLLCKLQRLGLVNDITIACGIWKKASQQTELPPEDTACFMTAIEGLTLSDLKPKTLRLLSWGDEAHQQWSIPIHVVVKDGQLPLLQDLFQSVQSLELDLWIRKDNKAAVDQFLRAVSRMPCLKQLGLVTRDDIDDFLVQQSPHELDIGKTLLECNFLSLQKMEIYGGTMDLKGLVPFLRRQPALGHLILKSTYVVTLGFTEPFDEKDSAEIALQKLAGIKVDCDDDSGLTSQY